MSTQPKPQSTIDEIYTMTGDKRLVKSADVVKKYTDFCETRSKT